MEPEKIKNTAQQNLALYQNICSMMTNTVNFF